MRFQDGNAAEKTKPVQVTLKHGSGNDLDLFFDEILVGFFADGKFYTISFLSAHEDKVMLEEKGVHFVQRKTNSSYRIEVEL